MVVDRVAVAVTRGLAEVDDRAVEPVVGGVAEAQPSVVGCPLAAAALSDELVTQRAGGGDAAVDGSPALFAGGVLEADLEDAGWAAVDVAFDPLAARSACCARASRSPTPRVRGDAGGRRSGARRRGPSAGSRACSRGRPARTGSLAPPRASAACRGGRRGTRLRGGSRASRPQCGSWLVASLAIRAATFSASWSMNVSSSADT